MSSPPGCQCAMQNFSRACKPADTDHYRACHTTFLSAELIQESFQRNFSLSPLSLLNSLMNHEPTILCELFRDQFRDLCKATPHAIGTVAKPMCYRPSKALHVMNRDRQALCCLTETTEPNTKYSFYSTYKQRKIQLKPFPRCIAESCTYSVDFSSK